MFGTRGLLLAIALLAGYFYFMGSPHKDRTLNSLSKLLEVENSNKSLSLQVSKPAAPRPAEDKASISLAAQEAIEPADVPIEQLGKFLTGTVLKQEQGVFQILRLRAVWKQSYTSEMGTFIDQRMNLVFFDPAEGVLSSLPPTFPVVMKSSNGQLGFISGTLRVTMKNIQEAGNLAQRFGLDLKVQDDTLGLAQMVASRPDQVRDLITDLQQDPLVKSVEAEIVQSWKKK